VNVRGYPESPTERDQWVLSARGNRNSVQSDRAFAWFAEAEPDEKGVLRSITTIFLTNRECPFRCVMCDLWKNTLTESVKHGDIPTQISTVLRQAPACDQIKLYNSGSFFDPAAIPVSDYEEIAGLLSGFERIIVESHPAFLGANCLRFQELIDGRLQVAIGLETANPEALEKLNKRMSLKQFFRSADFLARNGIALRVFLLVNPPFIQDQEDWLKKSIDFAFDCGASVVSLIPTRTGNGAIELLAEQGLFSPPRLSALEDGLDYGMGLQRGRVFADLWDLEKFSDCALCFPERRGRLEEMNLKQQMLPRIHCQCSHGPV
jgi:radical SAM enzyme (TIGR01210 family)